MNDFFRFKNNSISSDISTLASLKSYYLYILDSIQLLRIEKMIQLLR
jgi:hypothetical protein